MSELPDEARIEPDDIRSELARVLASNTFARSERARAMLQYLVEQELAGKGDLLKGFTIAQDVFDRSDDFDPAMDAVVRVQAGRLRDQLTNYYADEGAHNPLMITIPRGTYVPTYDARDVVEIEASAPTPADKLDFNKRDVPVSAKSIKSAPVRIEPDTPVSPFVVRNLRRFWIAVGSMLALLVAILALVWSATNQISEQEALRREADAVVPPGAGVPGLTVQIQSRDGASVDQDLAARVRSGATRFGTIRVQAADAGDEASGSTDYLLTIGSAEQEQRSLELMHKQSGELVWERTLVGQGQVQVASALTALMPGDGVIYRDAEARGTLFEAGQCLVAGAEFFSDQTFERFETAYDCAANFEASTPPSALINALYADLTVEAWRDGYQHGRDTPLADALASANRAIEVQSELAQGHLTLGNVLLARGETVPAVDAFRRAFEINPYDLSLAASYGYALFEAGDCTQAMGLLDRATGNVVAHPSWWNYTKFLCAFELGDRRMMANAANGLARYSRSYYLAARAISADVNGDLGLRDMLITRLSGMNTGLTQNPDQYYARYLPERLARPMTEALRAAGYGGSGNGA